MTFIHYYLSRAGVSLWQLLFPAAGTAGGDNPVTFFRCLNGSRAPPEIWLQLWALRALKIWPSLSVSARHFPNKPDDNAESYRRSSPGVHTGPCGGITPLHAPSQRGLAGLGSTGTATSQRPPGSHQIHANLSPKLLCHEILRAVLGQNRHSLLPLIFLKIKIFYLTF